MAIENPILFETRIEQLDRISPVYEFNRPDYFENPNYDVFGSVILQGEQYFIFRDHVVHAENVERYFEDFLKAEMYTKK